MCYKNMYVANKLKDDVVVGDTANKADLAKWMMSRIVRRAKTKKTIHRGTKTKKGEDKKFI